MTDRTFNASRKIYARTDGLLYLFIILTGSFTEGLVRSRLIVPGDAVATANNIVAHELLFRSGGSAELLMLVCDVAVALIFYVLLRPLNRNLALLTAFLRLVMAAILGVNALNHFSAVLLLGGASYLTVFTSGQLQALALLVLKAQAYGYHIGLVFFSFDCLFLGYLISGAGYFPKIIGILLEISGLCYLTNRFVNLTIPAVAVLAPIG